MKVRLLLAHTAEVQAGMLYVLGGGWIDVGWAIDVLHPRAFQPLAIGE